MQQLLLGLKRENKDNLELVQKEHDEALFKLRGEQATSVEYYVEKIQTLEEQLQNQNKQVGNKKKSFPGINEEEKPISPEDVEETSKTNLEASKVVEEGTVQKIVKREISLPVGDNAPATAKVHRGIQVDLTKSSTNPEDLMSPMKGRQSVQR